MNLFHDRINQRQIIAQGGITETERYLWFEDVHWLLLLIGSFFNDSDKDLAVFLNRAYKNEEYAPIDMPTFMTQCLQQTDAFTVPPNADPVTIICGMVAHWTAVLLHSLEASGSESSFVSPEICRSTLRTFATVVNFLTTMRDDQSSFFVESVVEASDDLGPLPVLPTTGEFSALLIDFIIRVCFSVFRVFPAEKK
jgi:hypothetical protein